MPSSLEFTIMRAHRIIPRIIFIPIITFAFTISVNAQERKVAQTEPSLFSEIARMDSIMFSAFNIQNMEISKPLFTADLEWYQDNGGLIPYKTVFENFGKTFKNVNKLTRQLVKGSLEVYPIKDYGAIEIGTHQFRHMENGRRNWDF